MDKLTANIIEKYERATPYIAKIVIVAKKLLYFGFWQEIAVLLWNIINVKQKKLMLKKESEDMLEKNYTHDRIISYLVAILMVILAFFLQKEIFQSNGIEVIYLTFYPAITIAALYGGFSAGSLATLLSVIIILSRVIGTGQLFHISVDQCFDLVIFLMGCAIICYVCEVIYFAKVKAEERAQELQDENGRLEDKVFDRTQALIESEERFRLATEAVGIIVVDFDLIAMRINILAGLKNLLGYDVDITDVPRTWWGEHIHPNDIAYYQAFMEDIEVNPREFTLQYRIRHQEGHYLFVEACAKPVSDETGRIVRIIGTVADITQRKQMETELERAREDHFRQCLDSMLDCFAILKAKRNEQGQIVDFIYEYVNQSVCHVTGLIREEHIGKGLLELFPGYERSELLEKCFIVANTGESLAIKPIIYSNEQATTIIQAFDIRVIKLQDQIAVCWRNITKEKQAEVEIAKQSQQWKNILNSISDGFCSFDNEWRYTYINPAAEKLKVRYSDKDKLLGVCYWDVFSNEQPFYDQYHKAKRENIAVHFETTIVDSSTWVQVHAYPSPEGLSVLFRDITEQKKVDSELARLDRLNLIGEMAASIGHEIRNPLTTVRGYLQLFEMKQQYDEHKQQFRTMIEEVDRANAIITEFLSLAKDRVVELTQGNLNNVLNALFPLMQAEAFHVGHTIQMDASNLPDIYMDEKELRQMLLNLVRNGFEAMPFRGILAVKSYVEDNKVVLAVQDNGTGIPKEVLDRIGTPFLTTKDNGTGLGLAVCYRIAQRHGAIIEVDTSAQGTTFFIKFPYM